MSEVSSHLRGIERSAFPLRERFCLLLCLLAVSAGFPGLSLGANSPPTISSIPDKTVLAGTSTPVGFKVGDVETPAEQLLVSVSSSNSSVLGFTNYFVRVAGANRTLILQPSSVASGVAKITLVVSDAALATRTNSFLLTVVAAPSPPIIVSDLADRGAAQGENVRLECEVIGTSPLLYQWSYNAIDIPGATNPVLKLPNVQPRQSGSYRVRVSNSFGSISSAFGALYVTLSPRETVWSYWDQGNQPASDWFKLGFDDRSWPQGRARFGYGVGGENTLVSYGANGADRYITTYFRHSFAVNNPRLHPGLSLKLLCDDGAAVYLNGTEIVRTNLPEGPLDFSTLAAQAVVGGETSNFLEFSIDPALLIQGLNVLAVEVHQVSAVSSDLSFDLELRSLGEGLPSFAQHPQNKNVSLGATDVTLSAVPVGPGPFTYQWQLNGQDIQGANGATYTIPLMGVTNAGSYRVVVTSPAGSIVSEAAMLTLDVEALTSRDAFAFPATLSGKTGLKRSNSAAATKESREPDHAGKKGGRSVWFQWTAPEAGVATFATLGSTFDTLLALYTGSSVSDLTEVASDEDGGGYRTSQVQFNAIKGVAYKIAVDGVGFGGAGGEFLINWELKSNEPALPVIVTQPQSQGVLLGEGVTFSVTATGPQGLTYQWFFEDVAIPDATTSSLTLFNVRPSDVGHYSVRVKTPLSAFVFSRPALLEVGSISGLNSFDKLEDIYPSGFVVESSPPPPPAPAPGLAGLGAAPTSQGHIVAQLGGDPIDKYVPMGQQDASDPLPSDSSLDGTIWMEVLCQDSMILEVDTVGSQRRDGSELWTRLAAYDTSVAGYELRDVSALLASDTTSAALRRGSRMVIKAAAGQKILLLASADNCGPSAPGCRPPVLAFRLRVQPLNMFVAPADPVVFAVSRRSEWEAAEISWTRNRQPAPERARTLGQNFPATCDSAGLYECLVRRGDSQVESIPVARVFVEAFGYLYWEVRGDSHSRVLALTGIFSGAWRLERSSSVRTGWETIGTFPDSRVPVELTLPWMGRNTPCPRRGITVRCPGPAWRVEAMKL